MRRGRRFNMGTEAFWVPAVLAAVSSGASYANQSAANSRSDQAEAQAIRNQQAIQNQGMGKVTQLIKNVASSNPNDIANQATSQYVSTLRRNAAGSTQGGSTTGGTQTGGASVSSLAPATVGSSRYKSDTGASQKQVQDFGNTYAGEMGDVDAAVRQRQNEGLSMEDLSTQLNKLNAQSYGQNFVDQLRAQTAGLPNPWVSLFSSMLGSGARGMAMNGFGAGGTPASAQIGPNGYTLAGTPVMAGNPGYGAPIGAVA